MGRSRATECDAISLRGQGTLRAYALHAHGTWWYTACVLHAHCMRAACTNTACALPMRCVCTTTCAMGLACTARACALRAQVRFESGVLGKEGYYEQLDEISVRLPPDVAQHYDVYVHVYVASPLGDRRIGYRRYRTAQLLSEAGWSAAPQWASLSVEPALQESLSIHGAMLQLSLRFGTDKQVKAAAPRRPHVRIPKLMRYELRAHIYQARDLQAADDNGLADPYVKVSLAGASGETEVTKLAAPPQCCSPSALQPPAAAQLSAAAPLGRPAHAAPLSPPQVIERTLQPIWYQSVTLLLELPRDLTLAPKARAPLHAHVLRVHCACTAHVLHTHCTWHHGLGSQPTSTSAYTSAQLHPHLYLHICM